MEDVPLLCREVLRPHPRLPDRQRGQLGSVGSVRLIHHHDELADNRDTLDFFQPNQLFQGVCAGMSFCWRPSSGGVVLEISIKDGTPLIDVSGFSSQCQWPPSSPGANVILGLTICNASLTASSPSNF